MQSWMKGPPCMQVPLAHQWELLPCPTNATACTKFSQEPTCSCKHGHADDELAMAAAALAWCNAHAMPMQCPLCSSMHRRMQGQWLSAAHPRSEAISSMGLTASLQIPTKAVICTQAIAVCCLSRICQLIQHTAMQPAGRRMYL